MTGISPEQKVEIKTESPAEVVARRLGWPKRPARRRKRKKTHKGAK